MEINKKLCKLFFQFPAICIYGNEGDFSRYKILKKIYFLILEDKFFRIKNRKMTIINNEILQ